MFTFLDRAALLSENPDWPGTRRVDVRHPSWRSLVLDRRIPSLVSRGFTGLMFDTLDTPPYLELLDPVRYHGMRDAAIGLVDAIRVRWPGMMLIMNRGYALLPRRRSRTSMRLLPRASSLRRIANRRVRLG